MLLYRHALLKTWRLIFLQTAGLTVAARLTEDPAITVAVLEAGAANIDDPLLGKLKSLL